MSKRKDMLCSYCRKEFRAYRTLRCSRPECRAAHSDALRRRAKQEHAGVKVGNAAHAASAFISQATVERRQEGVRMMLDSSFRGFAAKTGSKRD